MTTPWPSSWISQPPPPNPKSGGSPKFKIPPAKSSIKLLPAKSAFCHAFTPSQRASPIRSHNRNGALRYPSSSGTSLPELHYQNLGLSWLLGETPDTKLV